MRSTRAPTTGPRAVCVVAAVCLLAPAPGGASEVFAVSLEDTVAHSEGILVVEVLEPLESLNPCEINYGFRYRIDRVLLGPEPAAAEDLYLASYPRGDVTSEQCPVSFSFDAYFGDVRPPFEQGQRLIIFLGERVPQHAFESAERVAEVEALLGPRAPRGPPPAPEEGTEPGGPPVPPAPPGAALPAPSPEPPAVPPAPATGPTVLESEGRPVEPGSTELVFVSDDAGVAVAGGATSVAGAEGVQAAPRGGGAAVACRTPCRMRVPNGSYLFRVGTYEFPLAATGGFQTWEVDEANEAAQAAGEHLTYDGIGSLLGGGILIAAELGREGGSETSPTAIIGYSILGLGAVSLLIGAPLWALCGGSAELISAEPLDEPGTGDAGAATAFALIPGPVAFDPWSGRSAWGLTLALRL